MVEREILVSPDRAVETVEFTFSSGYMASVGCETRVALQALVCAVDVGSCVRWAVDP